MQLRQQAIRVQSKINALDQKVKEWLLLNMAYKDSPSKDLYIKKELVKNTTSDLFEELKLRLEGDQESFDRLLNLELEWKKIKEDFPGHNALEYFSFETKQLEKAQLDKIGIQGPLIDSNFRLIYLMSTILLILSAFVISAALYLFRKEQHIKNQLIDELRISKEEAQASSRLKSQILATVSHEIRTPLNGIVGMCEILNNKSDLQEPVKQKIQVIHDSGKTLTHIINDILDFSKVEAGKVVTNNSNFSLYKVCQNVIEALNFQAQKKGIALQLEYQDGLHQYFKGDKDLISQVLYNLVGNSVKFTKAGFVTLKVEKYLNDHIQIQIIDTGVGIEKESLSRIFEPFFQSKNSTGEKGTGLGLAICKRLVDLMSGRIRVSSTPDKGTEFTVQLPLAKGHEPKKSSSQSKLGAEPKALPKFDDLMALVVEDNPTNQLIITKMLEILDIKYKIAQNGEEALVAVNEHNFQCVFMDCQMPVMDGYEATKRLRALGFKPKIFAMTANAAQENKKVCLELGMNDFISKPVSLDEIARVLKKNFRQYITKNKKLAHSSLQNSLENMDFISFENNIQKKLTELSNETNKEVTKQILDSFYESLSSIQEEFDKHSNDLAQLQKIAHKYKSSSQMIGVDALVSLCKKVELAESLDIAQKHITTIKKLIPDVQKTLAQIAKVNL